MQVKVFVAAGDQINKLEEQINEFLGELSMRMTGPRQVAHTQVAATTNQGGWPFVVATVWYEDPERARLSRLA